MKILITGGLGFIGSALASSMIDHGHHVTLVVSLSPQIHGAIPCITPPVGAQLVRMDVRQLSEHPELIEACDAVYHLAAETGTAQSMYRIAEYVGANDLGTASLLEGIAKCTRRPARVVLASSRSVYGEGAYVSTDAPDRILQPASRSKVQLEEGRWELSDSNGATLCPVPTPESMAFAPGSVYAATKASQELLLQSAASALGFKATIFRFQNVYGEGQSLRNPYTGIISIFFNRARQGLEIPIYEDGLESRDFVHLSDVVRALVLAATADLEPGTVMNLGSGEPTSVLSLARSLLDAACLDAPIRITGQFRVGDIRHCYADLTKARALIGYEPQISLSAGLQRFCAWAVAEPIHEDRSVMATAELRARGLTN